MNSVSLAPDLAAMLACVWPDQADFTVRAANPFARRGTSYLTLPRPSRTSLLLPAGPRRVTRAALSAYKSPTTSAARARSRALGAVAGLGLVRAAPQVLTISQRAEQRSLIGHLAGVTGKEVVGSVHVGPPRANRKPVLQLIEPTGTTVGYAKVGTNGLTKARVEGEAQALDLLLRSDLGRITTPRVVAHGQWGECQYLLLEPVDTWSVGGVAGDVRRAAARDLVSAFDVREASLRDSPWWQGLHERLMSLHCQDAHELAQCARRVDELVGDRRLRFGASHGDWTPWNMATTPDERAVVWDWERFSLDTPIGFDELHYALQSGIRLKSLSTDRALVRVRALVEPTARGNGARAGLGVMLWVLYLLSLGEHFIRTGQAQAGARKGPLSSWLLPALPGLVDQLDAV